MKNIIGFAQKFYTLWSYNNVVNYVTDAYGKQHGASVTTHYHYIKNISFSLDKVKELYPGIVIDENVRGKVRDFSETKPLEKGLPENYFWNGKYRGMLVDEILESDFNYCLWYADNGVWGTAQYIQNHEIYRSHFQAIRDAENAAIANASTLQAGDVVDLDFVSNVYNTEESDMTATVKAAYGNVTVYVCGLAFKQVYGRFPYAMPMINGRFQRSKNKTFKVEVVEILNIRVTRDGNVCQTIKIK